MFTREPEVAARPTGVALEVFGCLVAEEFDGVAAFDQRHALGDEALQFDRTDFGAVLFLLASPLRQFVAVEFAFDPLGGAVEEIDGRPQQVLEVWFETGFAQASRSGRQNVGDGVATCVASGSGLGSGSS